MAQMAPNRAKRHMQTFLTAIFSDCFLIKGRVALLYIVGFAFFLFMPTCYASSF